MDNNGDGGIWFVGHDNRIEGLRAERWTAPPPLRSTSAGQVGLRILGALAIAAFVAFWWQIEAIAVIWRALIALSGGWLVLALTVQSVFLLRGHRYDGRCWCDWDHWTGRRIRPPSR